MQKLNERKTDGGLAEQIEMLEAFADSDNAELLCLLLELRRHRQDNWKQRAEAAEHGLKDANVCIEAAKQEIADLEAKLAELDKQDPVGTARMEMAIGKEGLRYYQCFVDMRPDLVVADLNTGMELFTRPAPAVNLVDLVPQKMTNPHQIAAEGTGWNDCRAAILRNIEEAHQKRQQNIPEIIPEGWKLVPVEPTPKQWAEGVKAMDNGIDKPTLCYRAMLAAAPEVK